MRRPLLTLLAALLLTGCSQASDDPSSAGPSGPSGSSSSPEPPRVEPLRYVALGDSYTAAPLVPRVDGASGPCVRSTANYPALVADALDAGGTPVRLVDRSCVEADVGDLFAPQAVTGGEVPAQAAPLDRRTDLVTVGIGGNDVLGPLLGSCVADGTCADLPRSDAAATLDALRTDLVDALRRVAEDAPRAEVLLVGYPQTAPPSGTCDALAPVPAADAAYARGLADGLDATLRAAAGDAGVGFVDAYAASAGHDICAAEPWVAGTETVPGEALALHPFARGQEGVADLVLEATT
ncbi:SGNH/GDSL hydrolase family protein [Nocardioides sp. CFH 31398]|uniref:SGNH/GDSL hydrolase family protein n=1 Tax=Nocardioides sp. CFH 31398 TaxID=2919579 RepID=UPI001F057C2F|nr:SGNH/GDSL hydrolase family protein [Nocardioides sp. CFH 31398]MCH1864933.1 SGNH/GDSL hydrolase family protein [Nocardioides sp. CFH 31398]